MIFKDKKATRRVNVMLKRTKSANQSVIQDAVDKDNTAVTLAGPSQPDEDDYGYVSQEAAAFYNKMMEKYSKMPDEPRFSLEKKKKVTPTNLNGLKDKVIAALDREHEPVSRKRKRTVESEKECVRTEEEEPKKLLKAKPPPPPPMNFADLLKIAEKKQFEPIVIEQKEKKDEERLLTKKQKKEMEREREWRERKEGKGQKIPKLNGASGEGRNEANGRIPKVINGIKQEASSKTSEVAGKISTPTKPEILHKQKPAAKHQPVVALDKPKNDRFPLKTDNTITKKPEIPKLKPSNIPKPPPSSSLLKGALQKPIEKKPLEKSLEKPKPSPSVKNEVRPKHFPPKDVRSGDIRRKPTVNKRRILDDDEEDYDPEMDDFIDDGPEEHEDYSKYISEIFGYDKSKYRYMDEDDDHMESSFSQQLKEEYFSTKIGELNVPSFFKQACCIFIGINPCRHHGGPRRHKERGRRKEKKVSNEKTEVKTVTFICHGAITGMK